MKYILDASAVIELELSKLNNPEKLEKVRGLYSIADQGNCLTVADHIEERAIVFQRHGIKLFDSLHLALAEMNRLDIFLTTDDSFLAAAVKCAPGIKVANPVGWLMEVLQNG